MQKVYLNGPISKFGKEWNTSVSNVGEVFKLISCQSPGFDEYIVNMLQSKTNSLEVVKGSELLVDAEDVFLPIEEDDLIITEIPYGAGDNPLETILIGITLFVAPYAYAAYTGAAAATAAGVATAGAFGASVSAGFAAAFTGTFAIGGMGAILSTIGLSLMINSVISLFTSGPETDAISGDMEAEKAKMFAGPETVSKQGIPVPVLYGELAVGGANINGGFHVLPSEEIIFEQHFKDSLGASLTNNGG